MDDETKTEQSRPLPPATVYGPVDQQGLAQAEAQIAAEWQVGETLLDLYEVTGLLGEGGMGKVYKVHHKGWNTDLAVKSPRSEIFSTAGGKENFIREAETWVNLGLHPHTVSCYYVRTLGDIPRVFAEYVEGGSLQYWIRTRGLYEGGPEKALERILDIAIQFAWGLDYAHERGLVHQDVKPANVMMTADGTAKVTDFGLAKARGLAGEAGVAAAGGGQSILVSTGGMTPAYCSPEQAVRKALTRATDVWSWGLSVLEMFTGEVTWMAGQAAAEALESYLEMGTDDAAIPQMPEAVAALLKRCFAHDPEARPHTMRDIGESLREIYEPLTGKPYARAEPKTAELTADSLNNRALSFLDLGKQTKAESAWQSALAADPQHPQTTYNRGVALWRRGELTDIALLPQLEAVRVSHGNSWETKHLLALAHLERGDVDSALSLLEEAAREAPTETELQKAIKLARSGEIAPARCLRTFEGHTHDVNSVCFSPDGCWALSGSKDMTLRLWEVATGRCVRTFEGHTERVYSVCLSAHGRWALSGGGDKSLRLWEVATGRCLRTLEGHTRWVNSVCLSADGRWALSGSADKTLRLWEVATGRWLRTFEGHTDDVNSVCFSPDGRWALSGSWDKTLRLWEVATGRCLRTFEGHTNDVYSVCLTADGRSALSGGDDKTLRLWEAATGRCLRTLEGHTGPVRSVCLSADGRWALSGSRDETLRLWELATGRCLRTLEGHPGPVLSVCLSLDGRWALSGSEPKTVLLWELPIESGRTWPLQLARLWSYAALSEVETRAHYLLKQAEVALQEARVATALGHLREARALPGRERAPESLEALTRVSLSCQRVALRGGWPAKTFEGHTERVVSVCLSADARWALSGNIDYTVRLWEVATGRCLRTFEGHTERVVSVCMSADARWALSGSWDQTLRLWEVATGRCLRIFEGHRDSVTSVSLSADGRWALSGSQDRTLRLWEVATGRCLGTLEELKAPEGAWYSPEVPRGRCLRTLEGHTEGVLSVCLSADSRWAVSGSKDKTVRLWEAATGGCLRTLEGHTELVSCVCLSVDGRWALSGSSDKTLRLWELDWELEAREPTDWDAGTRPYLENFLTLHTPLTTTWEKIRFALTFRRNKPIWTEKDFKGLLNTLGCAGYGWLRPEGVRRELEKMAAHWTGPPPLNKA